MVRRSRVKILQEQKEKIEKQLKQALTIENTKNRKLETGDNILLGVMFQGLIAEGSIAGQCILTISMIGAMHTSNRQ